MDYSKTLNLPQTEFPMRGNLPEREPEILERWESEELYENLMKKNDGKPLFVLHDGPPYANGDMHMGHALNKTLKDIIARYKNMAGFKAPYIHGWDTHGLPIERQAIKKMGVNRDEVSVSEFRKVCEEFALSYVENQKKQIKRLGAIGDYDRSYLTLKPEFEAKQIEVFGEMVKRGLIYKGLKPIYWCTDCETALAEAEIEYEQDKTNSIYVKFLVKDDKGVFESLGLKNIYFVIWTTTTWTLPGNVAISLNPEFEYSVVNVGGEGLVIASKLVETVMKEAGIDAYETAAGFSGAELEHIRCAHPFLDRDSLVIVGDHVTLEAGTGCVHTAPGHGLEDFTVCSKYKELPIIVPVDSKGHLNEEAGEFAGLYYAKSNAAIAARLEESGNLLEVKEIIHQYPHCWRCHEPIVFRATEQWFASVESIKDDALKAIKNVQWVPPWGQERISSMVSDRAEWCISRQRTWGVPIPIFYCEECGHELVNEETIRAVVKLFEEKGSGAWYEVPAADILPKGTKCVCGHSGFRKETDIMDVWFDSGSSHKGVLELYPELRFPADIYLEGNDQYRGWFQSSLLTSVATKGTAPYKTVITHGMIVDTDGQKMSKSKSNGVSPLDIIKDYGADILRLWVVSADYKTDMRISKEILGQMSEAYRKIRNTARFILGNLSGFNPDTDAVRELGELDRWALMRLDKLIEKVLAAYDEFDFHIIYHAVYNFCVVDMSNFYLDIIKDRLYTEKADSAPRRAAQTVMHKILDALVRLLAPVLAYTSEEIWRHMPHGRDEDLGSVLFNEMPKPDGRYYSAEFEQRWERLHLIKSDVSKALEMARTEKKIGKSLDAAIALHTDKETEEFLASFAQLPELFLVSSVELAQGEGGFKGENISVTVTPCEGEKCERCWIYSKTVGQSQAHKTLCERCAGVLEG